jgi:hypothetical protein
METVLQWVPVAAGVVIAVTLIVLAMQLGAIRRVLQALLEQRAMLAAPRREEAFVNRASWAEQAPEQPLPERRPERVHPPPPAPAPQERVMPASAPAITSQPPPPAPIEPMRFEDPPLEPPLPEGVAEQTASAYEAEMPPAESAATASPQKPIPAEPKASRLPVVIGIVVLVCAIGFLAFLLLYTK